MVVFIKFLILWIIGSVTLQCDNVHIKFDTTYNDYIIIYNGVSSIYGQNPNQLVGKYYIEDSLTINYNDNNSNITIFFTTSTSYIDFNPKAEVDLHLKKSKTGNYYLINQDDLLDSKIGLEKSQLKDKYNSEIVNDTSKKDNEIIEFIEQFSLISQNEFTTKDILFIHNIFFTRLEMGYNEFVKWIVAKKSNNKFKEALLHLLFADIVNSELNIQEKRNLLRQIEQYTFTKEGKFSIKNKYKKWKVLNGEMEYSNLLLDTLIDKSNYSILYFTASWCGPCKLYVDSIKVSQQLSSEYKNVDFYLFAMEASEDDLQKIVLDYSNESTIYLEGLNSNPLCEDFLIQSIPSTLVLKNGKLLYKNWISPFDLPNYIRSIKK